jgi:hypothetical protein
MFDAVLMTKSEVLRKIVSYGIGIENNGIDQRSKNAGECSFAGSWQPHDQNFSAQELNSPRNFQK